MSSSLTPILVYDFDDVFQRAEERYGDTVMDTEFWHFFLDSYEDSFGNGVVLPVNWSSLMEKAGTDIIRAKLQAFVDEFGSEEMLMRFSW